MAQKVREVMSSEPVALQHDTSLQDAARQMREFDIGDVLVVQGDQLQGLLTDRDIVIRAVAEGQQSGQTIGEICSPDVYFIGPDDDVDDAVQLMRDQAIRRIPVVNGGAPIGMLSIGDLAIELDQTSALADISAAPPNK